MRGALIVFEGIDRCGKSTQVALLERYLKENNVPVRVFRFPGNRFDMEGYGILPSLCPTTEKYW